MVALAEEATVPFPPVPVAVRFWPQPEELPIAVRDWPQGLGPRTSASKPLSVRPIAVRTWVPKPEPKKPRLDQDKNVAQKLDSEKRPSCFKTRPDSPDRPVPLKKKPPEDAAAKAFTKRHYPAPLTSSLPDRQRVKQALEEFESLRVQFKKEKEGTGGRCRPDMEAWSEIRRLKPELCCSKRDVIGHAPGVEVGDMFCYRSEICLVGLHKQIQGGISWIKDDYGEPIATSVVFSGGYADDRDHGDTFVYTGSGGNNAVADKQLQATDQKLERGNLGLMNSHKRRKPVRVIRGVDSFSVNKVYSYDGLYDVVDVMQDTGATGCLVYKFVLKRCPGQPPRRETLVPCGKQKKSKLSKCIL